MLTAPTSEAKTERAKLKADVHPMDAKLFENVRSALEDVSF
jgi:hypothetical protein